MLDHSSDLDKFVLCAWVIAQIVCFFYCSACTKWNNEKNWYIQLTLHWCVFVVSSLFITFHSITSRLWQVCFVHFFVCFGCTCGLLLVQQCVLQLQTYHEWCLQFVWFQSQSHICSFWEVGESLGGGGGGGGRERRDADNDSHVQCGLQMVDICRSVYWCSSDGYFFKDIFSNTVTLFFQSS